MRLQDIINIIEKVAPKELKEDFDNVGLMVGDKEKEIKKILVALDCTLDVIEEAKDIDADLILTHHPLLFRKPSSITTDTLLGTKIIELIKSDINLYSAHTNWDSVSGGINDTLVELLGLNQGWIIDKNHNKSYSDAGIGRVVELEEEKTLQDIVSEIKQYIGINNLRYVGDLNNKIKKIAIINGSGQDYFEDSRRMGADLIITGDTTYHFVSDYKEMGLSIIDMGHFPSEWRSLLIAVEKVKEDIEAMDKSVEIVVSKKSKDPYNFI